MSALIWDRDPPELRSPVLVAAFTGWNDAASAATAALEAVASALDAEPVARIDPEDFYDFQVNRPTVRLAEGQARRLDWPSNVFLAAPAAGAERDLALLSGVEPNVRWRTFAETILEAVERFGIELVVTLGSLIADVAHTRPVPITGLASDPELVEELGLSRSTYEGPTGIVGVLHDGRLEGLTGVAIEALELEDAATRFDEQIDRAVATNPEIAQLVQQLEEAQAEAEDVDLSGEVPSGDAIAQELQRFLRQQDS